MKRAVFVMVVIAALIAAPSFGEQPENPGHHGPRCSIEGSWIGLSAFGPFTTELVASTPEEGSYTIQWTGGNGTWFGLCDGSVRNSTAYGTWKRTGPRTFELTSITFSIDADGYPVCMWKSSGWAELDATCQTGGVAGSIEIFAPDVNPFDGDPFYVFPAGGMMPFMRMTVDPWVE